MTLVFAKISLVQWKEIEIESKTKRQHQSSIQLFSLKLLEVKQRTKSTRQNHVSAVKVKRCVSTKQQQQLLALDSSWLSTTNHADCHICASR